MITVAEVIERYIGEMNGTQGRAGLRPIGASQMYTFRRLQKDPIGAIEAAKLTKFHVKDYCRRTRSSSSAATKRRRYLSVSTTRRNPRRCMRKLRGF